MEKNSNQFQREYAEFIEIAAHDLDAPLRKLSLLVDVINKKYSETQGEDVQPYITRINTCIHDMRSLIDCLTLLSSVTTSPLTIQVVDLEQVVSEVRQNTDLAAGNVVINSSSLPGLEGDPSQLRILFRNLIQNSLLFNTAEKKEICLESADITKDEIKQHGLKKDTTYSKIIISDNGIGFLQEDAEKYSGHLSGCMANQNIPARDWDWLYAKRSWKITGASFMLKAMKRKDPDLL